MESCSRVLHLHLIDDTAVQTAAEPWPVRYGIQRSREGQEYNEPNQDCAMLQASRDTAAFTVCDGVSLSFCGQVSARYLAHTMTAWMYREGRELATQHQSWETPLDGRQERAALATETIANRLKQHLQAVRPLAERQVMELELPEPLSPLVRDVLEEKRDKGSEVIYITGVAAKDPASGELYLLLAWQGDIRARLWIGDTEHVLRPHSEICTDERWSTHKGSIGNIHIRLVKFPLPDSADAENAEIRLVLYTDGLSNLDHVPAMPDDAGLDYVFYQSLHRPDSDDMTYLEIGLRTQGGDE